MAAARNASGEASRSKAAAADRSAAGFVSAAAAGPAADETAGAASGSGRRRRRRLRAAAAAALAAAAVFLCWKAAAPDFLAVSSVEVRGPVETLGLQEVASAVRASVRGNMITADIAAVKRAVEEISWIKSASVRRLWPHSLYVDVVRRRAVAIFEDGRLVSDEGVLFVSNDEPIERLMAMPTFSGDPQYVQEAVRLLPLFEEQARRVSARVKAVNATFRGSWSVVIESARFDAMKIELGRALTRNGPVQRLAQVLENLDRTADMMQGYPESIDARYRDAFAAQLPGEDSHRRWLEAHPGEKDLAAAASSPAEKARGKTPAKPR